MGYAKAEVDRVLDALLGFDRFLAPVSDHHSLEAQDWGKEVIEIVVSAKNSALRRAGRRITTLQMASDAAWKGASSDMVLLTTLII